MGTNRIFVIMGGMLMALSTGAIAVEKPVPAGDGEGMIRIRVEKQVLNRIDPRLFGQFLERPSFGETGPEAAVDEKGALQPEVVALLKDMQIPIVRYPGGTDVDYMDWTDMISNLPGREEDGRPVSVGHKNDEVTNRFGIDEYLRFADEMDWDSILVVNFFDALLKRKPIAEAARHAAGLVAYANAPVGAKLPEGMPDWPALRAKNGHAEPYGVKIFQIGNEWAMKTGEVKKLIDARDDNELAAWYVKCISAYADAMRAVDPTIELIIDAQLYNAGAEKAMLQDPEVRKRIQYVTMHRYGPWQTPDAQRDGQPVAIDKLEPAEVWLALAVTFGCYEEGLCTGLGSHHNALRELGYKVAVTEWNWNGSGEVVRGLELPGGLTYHHVAPLGAAGFLHGMMRQGDLIALATQSMLVGHRWQIAAIQLENKEKGRPLHRNGQGMVTTLYNQYHGDRRLELSAENVPMLNQPLKIGVGSPLPAVALLDVVATRSDKKIYLHVINRSHDRELSAEFDLSALGVSDGEATLRSLVPVQEEMLQETRTWMQQRDCKASVKKGTMVTTFPAASVSVMEVGL